MGITILEKTVLDTAMKVSNMEGKMVGYQTMISEANVKYNAIKIQVQQLEVQRMDIDDKQSHLEEQQVSAKEKMQEITKDTNNLKSKVDLSSNLIIH